MQKTALITGGNRGLGRATALAFAEEKARVVLVCRSEEKGRAAVEEVNARGGEGHLLVGDLASMAEVRRVAAEFKERFDRLDVLVNNAATIENERRLTSDNLEATFAVNHMAPFLLTYELLDRLVASGEPGRAARVVNVSDDLHRDGYMRWHDIRFKANYAPQRAYAMSKLAGVLFTRELARRLAGKPVTANAIDPGKMTTGFGIEPTGWRRMFRPVARILASTPEQGASHVAWLATSPELEGTSGKYFAKRKKTPVSAFARDEGLSRRIWTISEHLAGIRLMEFAA